MSQQINLLVRKRSSNSSAWSALGVLLLVVVVLLGRWAIEQRIVAREQGLATASAQQLQQAQAQLQARMARPGTEQNIDIATLKQQAEGAQKLLTLAVDLGSQQGYSRYFFALGSIAEEGVWLTDISISGGGKKVSVTGRALQRESVMRYAQKINAAFADFGVQFAALEITPETSTAQGAGPELRTVAFKLY